MIEVVIAISGSRFRNLVKLYTSISDTPTIAGIIKAALCAAALPDVRAINDNPTSTVDGMPVRIPPTLLPYFSDIHIMVAVNKPPTMNDKITLQINGSIA